jgi:hypothetical protein
MTEAHRQRVQQDCLAHNISKEHMEKMMGYQIRLLAGGGFKYLPTQQEICTLLTENGFQVNVYEEAYYQTNFLIQAEKC